jgi:hypothetical protein
MTTQYKVTGIYNGTLYAQYSNGWLQTLLCELDNNQPVDAPPGWNDFPLSEFDLLHSEMHTAKELKGKTVADKCALFCLVYKQHKGHPYRANKVEKANLKNVTVNTDLLKTYFDNVNYPLNATKSMADYVRHYNTVRDLCTNGKPIKSSFPAVYDKAYEQQIGDDVSKLQRYWAHLRNLGWHKVDGVWQLKPTV